MHTTPHRILVACILTLGLLVPLSLAEKAAAAPLIVIDPGHGGPYSNANANGLREKNVNLAIALELRRQLLARGYRVAMTRTTDRAVGLSDRLTWNWSGTSWIWYHRKDGHTGNWGGIPKDDLQARVDRANSLGADLFISIHNNGAASRRARGTETFASSRDPLGVALSRIVHRRIVARTGFYDRRAKTTDFYVCRWSNMPAILVEGAFITNPSDAWKLRQYRYRRRIALGIAEGVSAWMATSPYTTVVHETSASSPAALAAKLSQGAHPTGAPVAVLARSDKWAQNPGAPALAARLGGPLLWVEGGDVPTETAVELARLAPTTVVTVGTMGSFDDTLTAEIVSCTPGARLESLSGTGPAEVAASIAESLTPVASGHVFIADERDTAAMLAAAPIAARHGIPLLLTRDGALPATAQAFVAAQAGTLTRATLLGSASRVPDSVAGGLAIVRHDSTDMTFIASAMNARFYSIGARGSMRPFVANPTYGAGYLTTAWYASASAQPVVPAWGQVFPRYTRAWITNRRPAIGSFEIVDANNAMPRLLGHMLRKIDRE